MVQLSTQSLVGIRNSEGEVLYVYNTHKEVWPGKPINLNNFLKYYPTNVKQSFRGVKGDPDALWDSTLKYSSTGFGINFLGPDTARQNPYINTFDEFFSFKSTNIIAEFNSYVDVGRIDQYLGYESNNIINNFIGNYNENSTLGQRDSDLVYKSTGFGINFLGPDTARNPYSSNYEEFIHYNISTDFKNEIIKGIFDQNINYSYSNIITTFIGDYNEERILGVRDLDTNYSYKGTEFGINFIGPDTARNPYNPNYEEFIHYNISNDFIEFTAKGTFDQNLNYFPSSFEFKFAASEDGSALGIYDLPLSYKDNFITEFLGPDTGNIPFVLEYQEFLAYNTTTIPTEFKNPPDTGVKDFDLVYSYSIIPTYFLP